MKYWVSFCFCLFALFSGAQKGKLFPELNGETLDGASKSIPEAVMGKLTIVGMAYSGKSEDALKTWYNPMYDKFVLKRGIFDHTFDVNLVFVPMYIGLKQAAYEPTLKDLKSSNRKDLYPYLLFYKGELEPYGSILGLTDKNSPYFFVLDQDGKIVHTFSGIFTEAKMEAIEAVLDEYAP